MWFFYVGVVAVCWVTSLGLGDERVGVARVWRWRLGVTKKGQEEEKGGSGDVEKAGGEDSQGPGNGVSDGGDDAYENEKVDESISRAGGQVPDLEKGVPKPEAPLGG